jgi:hypothetical protein
MRCKIALVVSALFAAACSPDQDAARYVEAIEIPLDVATEREELADLLSAEARRHPRLHVDDVSVRYARYHQDIDLLEPHQRPTVSISVWRGEGDDELVATVGDVFHRGRVWATFLRGEDPEQETPFREAAIELIRERWPNSKSLPILPSGGLPNEEHFVLTDEGYKLRRSEAHNYDLPPDSDLFAAN